MRKVVRKSIRKKQDGIDLAADVNAVIAVNSGEQGGSESASSVQRVRQSTRSTARTADEKGSDNKEEERDG